MCRQSESLYGTLSTATNPGWQSYPDYLDLRDRNHSFRDLWRLITLSETRSTRARIPSPHLGFEASGNYFDVLRHSAVSGPLLPRCRRAWAEQRTLCRAHLRVLAQPFPGRSRRGGPRGSAEQASVHDPRRGAAGFQRNAVIFSHRFLHADGQPGADRRRRTAEQARQTAAVFEISGTPEAWSDTGAGDCRSERRGRMSGKNLSQRRWP